MEQQSGAKTVKSGTEAARRRASAQVTRRVVPVPDLGPMLGQDSDVALVLTVRAQLLIAALAAGTLVVGVSTVAQRSHDSGTQHGADAAPTVGPPSTGPTESAQPVPSASSAPIPTATASGPTGGVGSGGGTGGSGGGGGAGGGSGGSAGSGSGAGGGPMPGYKPKDGWPDVHGVVTNGSGQPLAGIYVTIENNTPDTWSRDVGAVTDSRGRFRVRCHLDANGNVSWRGLFVSDFPVSGDVPQALPDGAWKRITPECGLADDPDINVVLAHGADVEGTLLDAAGDPDVGTRNRIGVRCDGLPHGFINGWAPQLSFAVDPKTAHFRVYGLITDHCELGVIKPDGTRTQLTDSIAVTEGKTVHQDVREKA